MKADAQQTQLTSLEGDSKERDKQTFAQSLNSRSTAAAMKKKKKRKVGAL